MRWVLSIRDLPITTKKRRCLSHLLFIFSVAVYCICRAKHSEHECHIPAVSKGRGLSRRSHRILSSSNTVRISISSRFLAKNTALDGWCNSLYCTIGHMHRCSGIGNGRSSGRTICTCWTEFNRSRCTSHAPRRECMIHRGGCAIYLCIEAPIWDIWT